MSGSFTQVFGGNTIYPSDVSYLALALDADTVLEWPQDSNSSNVAARIIDVTPSGPYTIILSSALSVGVGTTILFNNLGPNTITVDKADGTAILSIGPGEQWQAYLTDNDTIGGSWRTFRYGAATAQAQASALAGPGLMALSSALAQNYPVTDFSTTPYTLTAPDRAKVFVWTGGLGTVNLPTAVAAGDGWFVQVRNAGQGDLTIDPSGSEQINGGSTLLLQPGDSAGVVSDGTQWYTIGLGQQAIFAFDYTSIAVTGGTYTLSGSELNRIAYKFTGTLVSNVTVVVPATVQQYWINNATTGAFTLSLQASGSGTSTAINQGETAILYCDGTDIIPATTSAPFAGILPVAQGGTGATTATSARANLGATGIGSAVFTASTTAAARSAIAAAASGANSDITSLSGLTTPLSVAQGGTGSGTASGARSNLGAAASGANTDITSMNPTGGLQVGAPTGGAKGTGTINATGLFINGVGVGTGSGSVTSVAVSGGTTGLTTSGGPVTTSGTITLAGTLAVANGGTGQTSYTDGQLLIGNSTGNTLTKATLTAGSGISITNGNGSITITSTAGTGTVTSVSGSGGTTGMTLSGGPITTSGTLTLGGTLAITSGGTGATSASGARLNLDVPSTTGGGASGTWSINISGNAATATSATTATTANNVSGTVAIANGGTGATTAAGARTALDVPSTGGSGASGTWAINISGNAATVTDGVVTSGSYSNPTWLTALASSKLTGAVAIANGGTSATTASGARSALGAAASGANTDITALNQDVSVTATGTIAADSIGYRGLPQNAQTSSYTLALADQGKHISITTGGVVIPANGSVAFPIGAAISIYNNSGSNQTISITTDTLRQAGTANTGSRTLAQYGLATVVKVASTTWVISGAGVS